MLDLNFPDGYCPSTMFVLRYIVYTYEYFGVSAAGVQPSSGGESPALSVMHKVLEVFDGQFIVAYCEAQSQEWAF